MRKLTIEFVRRSFEKKNYVLLTKEYIGSGQKLDYICSNGHKYSISWDSWKQGHGCPYCVNVGKPTINFIKSEFAKEKYQFLTKEYINSNQKLDYVCSKGHKHSVSWSQWHNRGFRCPYCSKKAKPDIKYIYKMFEMEGYRLLSINYINNRSKLKCICSNNHEYNVSWRDWQTGGRCPICRNEKMSVNRMGDKNPAWKGGIACEPYCQIWLDKEYKEDIKVRDDHQCQNIDCWKIGGRLTGHHIDYNKKNCGPSNIVTLCNSCNGRANVNRKYWTKFYQEIMNKKYGYSYG